MTQAKKFKSMKKADRNSNIAGYIILGLMSVVWLFPIVWIVLNALRTEKNDQGQLIGTVVSNYFPTSFGFDNFVNLFNNTQFPQWFLNTLFVSIATFVLSTILTLSVAYVMSKLKFRARKAFFKYRLNFRFISRVYEYYCDLLYLKSI